MADRRLWRAAPVAATLLVLAFATSASAAGPTVSIEPAGPLPDTDQTITVTGSGFDPEANSGFGIYVVFGPLTDAPTYYTDAELYGAARWVHVGASDSPGQAELHADGSFTTTLDVRPRYTDGHDAAIDCAKVECSVITMAAHGASDRSQDTFTPIAFTGGEGAVASGSPILAIVGLVGVGVLAVGAVLIRRGRRDAVKVESG